MWHALRKSQKSKKKSRHKLPLSLRNYTEAKRNQQFHPKDNLLKLGFLNTFQDHYKSLGRWQSSRKAKATGTEYVEGRYVY